MNQKKNKISKLLSIVIYSMIVVILGAITKVVFHTYIVSNIVLLVGMVTLAIAVIAFILRLETHKG